MCATLRNCSETVVRRSCAPETESPYLFGACTLRGVGAHPVGDGPAQVDRGASDSRALLRAVGVSGFAMMNIMLLSVAVWSGTDGATRDRSEEHTSELQSLMRISYAVCCLKNILLLAVLLLLLLVAQCLNCLEAVNKPPTVSFTEMSL